MIEQKARIACVGAGYFSQFHIESWKRMPGAELVGVCDMDIDKAKASEAPAFSDVSKMLSSCKPDVVDVVVPPPAHKDAIRQALAAGVKAIICQKPFCTSFDEAREITAEAEAAGIPLIIHENFRFQPWYRKIRDLILAGAVGDVLQATFRLRPGDGQGPDAYLDRQPYFQTMPRFLIHETAVHWIDTFLFLFGNPTAVYADLRQINPVIAGEDAGIVLFDHPGGVRSTFDGNRLLDHSAQNTRCTMGEALVEGTEGTITLYGDGSVRLRAFGSLEEEEVLGPNQASTFGGDCVYALNSHIVEGLKHGGTFENTAREYLRVIEIEEAIYHSAKTGAKTALA